VRRATRIADHDKLRGDTQEVGHRGEGRFLDNTLSAHRTGINSDRINTWEHHGVTSSQPESQWYRSPRPKQSSQIRSQREGHQRERESSHEMRGKGE
jgi:hypothetical protein